MSQLATILTIISTALGIVIIVVGLLIKAFKSLKKRVGPWIEAQRNQAARMGVDREVYEAAISQYQSQSAQLVETIARVEHKMSATLDGMHAQIVELRKALEVEKARSRELQARYAALAAAVGQ